MYNYGHDMRAIDYKKIVQQALRHKPQCCTSAHCGATPTAKAANTVHTTAHILAGMSAQDGPLRVGDRILLYSKELRGYVFSELSR